jgi:hypothetical protein
MIRFIKSEICDDDGNTVFNEGDEVEVYKSKKSEIFMSGIGAYVIGDNDVRDWICASFLRQQQKDDI